MTVYAIGLLKVTDQDTYNIYGAGVIAMLKKFDAKIVAVSAEDLGLKATILEGDWPYTRTLILSFPDLEKLNEWYSDPEYQELAKFRHASSTGQIAVLNEFKGKLEVE
ncbi:unnamed protein product [Discula destructiva]